MRLNPSADARGLCVLRFVVSVAVPAAMASCGGFFTEADTGSTPGGKDGQSGPGPTGGTTLVGLVLSSAGVAIAQATVTAGGATAQTDAQGRFSLPLSNPAATVPIVVERTGYAPSYKAVSPAGAAIVSVGVTLHPIGATATVDAAAGGAVQAPSGATISLPPSGMVVTATGKPASGPLTVNLTHVTPAQALNASPIPLLGSDGASTYPLISYGMVDVTVTDAKGQRCQPGAASAVQLTLTAGASDPDSAGLFYGDPAQGLWVLEGAATRTGTTWTAMLPHLSWWNVDAFMKVPKDKQCCVTFSTVSDAGVAVPGVEIKGTILNGYTYGGNTDKNGTLCHEAFPCGDTVSGTWNVYSSSGKSGPFSFVPFAAKAQCGTSACQIVTITVPCVLSNQCLPGQTCAAGACTGTPIGGPDATVKPPGPCVPSCSAGQCSDNGCGQPCMACPSGQTCGPSGVCAACVPNCGGKLCGSDGCNGSCGICPSGEACDGSQCGDPCTFCTGATCSSFGFEGATPLSGWDVSGEVAVIANLGAAPAPEGSKMLRLSTGLAVSQPSYIQKSLCGQVTGTRLQFRWRLYSEEFEDFCGSSYQDDFLVSVVTGGTKTPLFKVTIDEICRKGANNCATCGTAGITTTKADVSFDKGDVYMTPWQQTDVVIPGGASGKTIAFQVEDVGDSAYDTVVLIDDVRILP